MIDGKESTKLGKGEDMEEKLRFYFQNLGFYVARSVKYKFDGNDVTDVDLFLYGRQSILNRERINVDIKNKRTPQALERILWTLGLKNLLKFDSCIVATTDNREYVQQFGSIHAVTVLNGTFIGKLKSYQSESRLTEEEFGNVLVKFTRYDPGLFYNKDWKYIYEYSKSKLLTELDFSGFNSILRESKYFLEQYLTNTQAKEASLRIQYILLSHMLVIVDFVVKDLVFLEQNQKDKRLQEGFAYGNLGKQGIDDIIKIASLLAGSKVSEIEINYDEVNIFKDFFGKNENSNKLFQWAKEFEYYAFHRIISEPINLTPQLKAVYSIFLDFFNLNRKHYI